MVAARVVIDNTVSLRFTRVMLVWLLGCRLLSKRFNRALPLRLCLRCFLKTWTNQFVLQNGQVAKETYQCLLDFFSESDLILLRFLHLLVVLTQGSRAGIDAVDQALQLGLLSSVRVVGGFFVF